MSVTLIHSGGMRNSIFWNLKPADFLKNPKNRRISKRWNLLKVIQKTPKNIWSKCRLLSDKKNNLKSTCFSILVLKAVFSEIQSQNMSSSCFLPKTKPLIIWPARSTNQSPVFFGWKQLEPMSWLGFQKKMTLVLYLFHIFLWNHFHDIFREIDFTEKNETIIYIYLSLYLLGHKFSSHSNIFD